MHIHTQLLFHFSDALTLSNQKLLFPLTFQTNKQRKQKLKRQKLKVKKKKPHSNFSSPSQVCHEAGYLIELLYAYTPNNMAMISEP